MTDIISYKNQYSYSKKSCNLTKKCSMVGDLIASTGKLLQLFNILENYISLSAMFNSLHSCMNQELFEKHLCNQGNHYKNVNNFCYPIETITNNHQINTFGVSKDKWYTKESPWKKALYIMWYSVCGCRKAPFRLKHYQRWKNLGCSLSKLY